ncbi:adenosine kinase-like [Aphis craccivora]|uniref:Adenosine kinase-like n=1 Tax=Aphis craccivora TaxID=307492 RepID=A0A6G0ZH75_APHCR|nr:adenosine kinase-like [Aphis craccivora]
MFKYFWSNGDDGLDTMVVNGGLDDTVGHQLVGSYYADWYYAPQDVWCYYTEDAIDSLVDVDGTRYVATGRAQIRELFDNVAAPETANHEDDDGDCRSSVV